MAESMLTVSKHTPIYRKRLKFYRQSGQIFRLLHGIYSTEEENEEKDIPEPLHTLSSTSNLDAFVDAYTVLLLDYFNDIKHDDGVEANQERVIYQQIIFVWQLLQILFFSSPTNKSSSRCFGVRLMKWMNRLDKRSLLQYDIQGIFHFSIPSHHTSFWPLIYKLVLRGELNVLQRLLDVATQRVDDVYDKSILTTLRSCITAAVKDDEIDDSTMADRRKAWYNDKAIISIEELKIFRKSRPVLVAHASNVIHMMLGDITQISEQATSFMEAIVTSIYYYTPMNGHPDLTTGVIQKITQQVINLKQHSHELDKHVGLLALLKGNIYETLEDCSRLDWWLLAHMTDIMDRYILQRQQRSDHNVDDGECIFGNDPLYMHIGGERQVAQVETRVFFLQTYANKLVEQGDLWKLAFDYMGTCGMVGRSEISKAIGRVPLADEKVALQLADYCTRNGLIGKRQEIYRNLAGQLIQRQSYISAIRYYCLAGNLEAIDDIFKCLLQQYGKSRQLESFDELDAQYKSRCTGTQACFYLGFSKMHTLFKERNISEARDTAVRLLLSETSPTYFLPILFLENVALMEQCENEIENQLLTQLQRRLSEVVTKDNKEGIALLRIYLDRDMKERDLTDITDDDVINSVTSICKLVFDRSTIHYNNE